MLKFKYPSLSNFFSSREIEFDPVFTRAYYFDGSNDYVTVPAIELDMTKRVIISFRINNVVNDTTRRCFFGGSNTLGGTDLGILSFVSTRLSKLLFINEGAHRSGTVEYLNRHVEIKIDCNPIDDNIKLYVGGILDMTRPLSTAIEYSPVFYLQRIGHTPVISSTTAAYHRGHMYDFRVSVDGNLIHHYPMNEQSGNVCTDIISGNNGTIVNHNPATFFVEI